MWNLLIITLISICSSGYKTGDDFSLEEYRWKNRIILISPGPSSEQAQIQIGSLLKDIPGLQERDLLIFVIHKLNIRDLLNKEDYEIKQNLLDRLHLRDEAYELLLIGKDGGIKYRKPVPVPNSDIYNVIDQMPMRQAEIRRQN